MTTNRTPNFDYNYDNDIALGAAVLRALSALDFAVKNAKEAGLTVELSISVTSVEIATIQRVTKLWPSAGDTQ